MEEEKETERRSRVIIKSNFEKKILRLVVINIAGFMAVSLLTFYVALRIKINQAGFSGYTEERLTEVLSWLNWFLPLVAVILIVVAAVWAKHISFQIAGPLYALEKQLNLLIAKKIKRVKLRREDDEIIPLARLINRVIDERIVVAEKRADDIAQERQNKDA
ncbi:MAG: hypothetical protein ABIH89_00080 [Elusimicrobiota bacterium]